jgi:hypothetical protein
VSKWKPLLQVPYESDRHGRSQAVSGLSDPCREEEEARGATRHSGTGERQAGYRAAFARHRTRSRISVCCLRIHPHPVGRQDKPRLALWGMSVVMMLPPGAGRSRSRGRVARGTRAGTDVLPLLSPHPLRNLPRPLLDRQIGKMQALCNLREVARLP